MSILPRPLQPLASTADSESLDRREFIAQALAATGTVVCAATLASLVNSCGSPANNTPTNTSTPTTPSGTASTTLDIGMTPALAAVGGAISRQFGTNNGSQPVIVVRIAASEFLALSSICTHAACNVALPSSTGGDLVCPCHGSRFSSRDGSVRGGPAGSPLQRFTTSFDAAKNTLTIQF
jgi:cytochrome b6-f complex iron-sulfur subunit